MKAVSAGTLEIEFLTNVAKLKSDMDQAERAVASSTGSMGRSLATMNNGMRGVAQTSAAMRMSLAQIPDVISGLATGQRPMTILIQQGLQVYQVAQLAQGGVRGFAKEVAALALRFAPLLGVLAAVGAGLELFKSRMSDDEGLKAYANSLGLTHAEMKKLGDVSVTTGDIIKGTWRTLVQALDLGPPLLNAKKLLGEAADWAVAAFKSIAAGVYALFVGGYNTIVETWRQWPAALADLFVRAVNGAASAIEFLLNKSIDGVNAIAAGANKLTGTNIFGTIDHAQLARMNNEYAGAASKVGKTAANAFSSAYAEGLKGIASFSDKLFKNINDVARERIKKLADDMKADRASKKGRSAANDNFDPDKALGNAQFEQIRELNRLMDEFDRKREINVDLRPAAMAIGQWLKGLDAAVAFAADEKLEAARDSADRMAATADNLANSWGNVGRSIADAISALGNYKERQAEIDKLVATQQKSEQWGIKATADLQLNSLIGITDAAKNLFSQHSKGYKAMAAAEKALTIIQLARTAVDVAGGAARMFATLGPLAFPAVGAMLAVMASLGFSGGGSGGAAPSSNQGKGTVLGASDTESSSIKNSIEALSDIDRVTMQYSAQMAASLKSIESNIGGLAALLVRTGNISGATAGIKEGFSPSGLGSIFAPLGSVLKGIPILGDIAGLFSSLFGTKKKIVGSGIYGGSQDIASILNGGFDLQTYADIQKKKKFLGITTSTKYSTQYGGADPQVAQQFTLILKSFYEAIGAAAVPLGKSTNDVEKTLDSFVLNIGKIDFTGLSGDEIQKKLEAVFGAAADQMAEAAFPGIEKFQQVGEGAFETLTRVAMTVETVTSELNMLGLSSKSLGVNASMAIAGLFDSVDQMKSATQSYFETFYTTEEQTAIKTRQLSDVFTALGVAMPDSIAAYRSLVEAQDLTTDGGQKMYATLIQLAPAFAQIATAAQGATSAAAIVRERQDLEQKLLELQGDQTAIRAAELAKLDPSNRALMQRIYALQDEQAATEAATQAAQQAAAAQQAIADERAGLERQLLELQGNTAALRALDRAQINDSNKALFDQIQALKDQQAAQEAAAQAAQEAAQAAQEAAQKTDSLRQAWQSIGDTIEDEITRIRNLTGTNGTQSFAQLLGQFNAATEAARHGDQAAASSLPELSKAMLDAAAQVATSRQELDRVQAQTAASLETTLAMINTAAQASQAHTAPILGADTSAADSSNWWNSYAPANDGLVSEVRSLRDEVAGLRADQRIANAAMVSPLKKVARTLDDVTNGDQTINTVAA